MAVAVDTPIISNADNLDKVLGTGKPMLLVFEMPNCEPCQALDRPLKELARLFAGQALVVRVEDARQAVLETRFRITRLPTLVLWKAGSELGRIEGAAGQEAIGAHMEFLIGKSPRPSPASGPGIALAGTPASPKAALAQSQASASAEVSGAPVEVTDATFEQEVLRSPLPVLVDFWAPWCGPCRMVSPIVEELGREYRGRLKVAKVNTDDNPRRAGSLGIQGIPTLILFKNGREADRIVGAAPKPALKQFIERGLGK